MPRVEPAYCEDQAASNNDSEDDRTVPHRTVPQSKVSATKQKEEKKKSKKDKPRKEKRSRSDDGIVAIPRQDDEDTIADSVRVIPEERKESRHKSKASSPRKSSSRPIPTRERSVTFDRPAKPIRHDKNDPSYFGRKHGEDVKYTPNTSRPPLTTAPKMRPARPTSYDGRMGVPPFQTVYSPLVHPSLYAASPAPYMASTMPGSYDGAYFGNQQPNGLAARFGRTGQPTLDTAVPLEYVEPQPRPESKPEPRREQRREPRHRPRRRESEYEEEEDDEDEEDEYYEEDMLAKAEARQRERQRQKRILDAAELVLEEKRLEERRQMPPPQVPRRENSQRTTRRPPHVDYPIREHMSHSSHDRRGSSNSERPPIFHRESEPVRSNRRPSFGAAPSASSGGYDLPRRPRQPSIEISNPNGRRMNYFGGGTTTSGTTASSDYIEKEHFATTYQNEIAGDAAPLTTEWLNKQQKAIKAGSRSTRSTVSKDESEMRSATTRTTRSGSGDGNDNATFTVKGNATVMVDGAEISTRDTDGPIEISIKRNSDQKQIRNGSEASWAPSAASGISRATTAVSDDPITRRPGAGRRESMHGYKSSAENSRHDPRHEPRRDPLRDHHLRDRLEPLGRRPSNSRRDSRRESHIPMDFERDSRQW